MAFNRSLQHFTSTQELATVWVSSQSYVFNQLVLNSDKIYRCDVAHTSGGSFNADLTSGKWVLISAAASSPQITTISLAGNTVLSSSNNLNVFLVDTSSARQITAFAASSGFQFTVIDKTGRAGTNPISFVPSGSQKVQGRAANYSMEADFGSWTWTFDGTDWFLS
ncbi:hypothetical protein EBU99_14485 [bacterium]|nr:hypothetical protein [bacterium]